MEEKVKPFYAIEFFQKLPRGLPEAIVTKEEKLGMRLPGVEMEVTAKKYDFEGSNIWIGRVSEWYFIGFETKDQVFRYEVFESKVMFELFFMSRAKTLPSTLKGFWLREIEKINQ